MIASRRPHLVHVVQHLAPGGIEALVLALTATTAHAATIISLEGTVETLIGQWPRLEAIRHRLLALEKAPGLTPGLVLRLAWHLRRLKATACFTHGIGPLLYGGAAARLAGVRHRVHVDHDSWSLESTSARRLYRAGLELGKPVPVAVTDAISQSLGAWTGQPPKIVYNGIDTSQFCPVAGADEQAGRRAALGLPRDAFLIGAIGRLETVKGHDLLIRALLGLPAYCHLALAGCGTQREALGTLAATLGLSNRVHFLGLRDDPAAVLQALDVFCLPSRAEGLPLALLEAQSCGLPVVATAVGGVPAALPKGAGLVVPPECPEALAHGLQAMLDLPAPARHCVGATGRLFVLGTYSLDKTRAAYEHLALGEAA